MVGLTCRVGAHNSRYAHDTRLYPICRLWAEMFTNYTIIKIKVNKQQHNRIHCMLRAFLTRMQLAHPDHRFFLGLCACCSKCRMGPGVNVPRPVSTCDWSRTPAFVVSRNSRTSLVSVRLRPFFELYLRTDVERRITNTMKRKVMASQSYLELGPPVPLGASGDEKSPSLTVTVESAGSMLANNHLFQVFFEGASPCLLRHPSLSSAVFWHPVHWCMCRSFTLQSDDVASHLHSPYAENIL